MTYKIISQNVVFYDEMIKSGLDQIKVGLGGICFIIFPASRDTVKSDSEHTSRDVIH